MSDRFTAKKRSEIMAAVRGKNTTPELTLRAILTEMGLRYRLNVKRLPGSPDVVMPGRGCVIFVHGCFWHRHSCARGQRMPVQRRDYWEPKLRRNATRDRSNVRRLRKLGWRVLVIWECQLGSNGRDALVRKLERFLELAPSTKEQSR